MDMSKQKENVISYYKTMSLNTCVLEKQKWDKEGKIVIETTKLWSDVHKTVR